MGFSTSKVRVGGLTSDFAGVFRGSAGEKDTPTPKPLFLMLLERAKPEGLAHLEADRAFARLATHALGLRELGTKRFVGFSQEIPQGLKPISLARLERAKPEGLAYLEADRAFARLATHALGLRELGTKRFVGFSQEIPQGLKPISLARLERAKPEGLAYLEADRVFARWVTHAVGRNRMKWGTQRSN